MHHPTILFVAQACKVLNLIVIVYVCTVHVKKPEHMAFINVPYFPTLTSFWQKVVVRDEVV